jgi:hypothetical protein
MNKEDFCDKYCPMKIRIDFRNGDYEIDCSSEKENENGQYCPFGCVKFNEVKDLQESK